MWSMATPPPYPSFVAASDHAPHPQQNATCSSLCSTRVGSLVGSGPLRSVCSRCVLPLSRTGGGIRWEKTLGAALSIVRSVASPRWDPLTLNRSPTSYSPVHRTAPAELVRYVKVLSERVPGTSVSEMAPKRTSEVLKLITKMVCISLLTSHLTVIVVVGVDVLCSAGMSSGVRHVDRTENVITPSLPRLASAIEMSFSESANSCCHSVRSVGRSRAFVFDSPALRGPACCQGRSSPCCHGPGFEASPILNAAIGERRRRRGACRSRPSPVLGGSQHTSNAPLAVSLGGASKVSLTRG